MLKLLRVHLQLKAAAPCIFESLCCRFEWLADASLPRQQIRLNTLAEFSAGVQKAMGVPVVRFQLLKQPHLHPPGFEPNRAIILELRQDKTSNTSDLRPKHVQISAKMFPYANQYNGRIPCDCLRVNTRCSMMQIFHFRLPLCSVMTNKLINFWSHYAHGGHYEISTINLQLDSNEDITK
jgi:hypothetical protein